MKTVPPSAFSAAPLLLLAALAVPASQDDIPAPHVPGVWVRVNDSESWFWSPAKAPVRARGAGELGGKIYGALVDEKEGAVYYTRGGFGFGKALLTDNELVIEGDEDFISAGALQKVGHGAVVLGVSPVSRDVLGYDLSKQYLGDVLITDNRHLFKWDSADGYKVRTLSLGLDYGSVMPDPGFTKVAFSTRSLLGKISPIKGVETGVFLHDFAARKTERLCDGSLLAVDYRTDTFYVSPDNPPKREVYAFQPKTGEYRRLLWSALFNDRVRPGVLDEARHLGAFPNLKTFVTHQEAAREQSRATKVYDLSSAGMGRKVEGKIPKVLAWGFDLVDLVSGRTEPLSRAIFDAPADRNIVPPWFLAPGNPVRGG